MKITLIKETLEDILSLSSKFTSTKLSSVQSLQGARIRTTTKGIEIITTNLSDFFHTTTEAKIGSEGEIVIDVKKVLEFIHYLQPGEVNIEEDGTNIKISQGKTEGFFATFPSTDFPEVPKVDGDGIMLDKKLLEKLSLVALSASKDESRPVLTGLYIDSADDKNIFVSTDGFRLSLLTIAQDKNKSFTDGLIVPANVLLEVSRLSESIDVRMVVSKENKLIKFSIGQMSIYSRIIEGDFPPYGKVVPKDNTTKAIIDRTEFQKNIRLVSVFAKDQGDVVVFDISSTGMYISPKNTTAKKTKIFQEIESLEGQPLKIAFNYRYVLDFLGAVGGKAISIECTQSTAPGVFKSPDQEGFLHIIMPLRTEETTG